MQHVHPTMMMTQQQHQLQHLQPAIASSMIAETAAPEGVGPRERTKDVQSVRGGDFEQYGLSRELLMGIYEMGTQKLIHTIDC